MEAVTHRIWRRSNDPVFRAAAVLVVVARIGWQRRRALDGARSRETSFAAQIAALSEPDGYFDTDNLISNERVVP